MHNPSKDQRRQERGDKGGSPKEAHIIEVEIVALRAHDAKPLDDLWEYEGAVRMLSDVSRELRASRDVGDERSVDIGGVRFEEDEES